MKVIIFVTPLVLALLLVAPQLGTPLMLTLEEGGALALVLLPLLVLSCLPWVRA